MLLLFLMDSVLDIVKHFELLQEIALYKKMILLLLTKNIPVFSRDAKLCQTTENAIAFFQA